MIGSWKGVLAWGGGGNHLKYIRPPLSILFYLSIIQLHLEIATYLHILSYIHRWDY